MLSRGRPFIAPAYLFACLVLGGSAQGIWQNMALQLAGLALIAWAASALPEEPLARSAEQLLWLAIAAIVIVAIQLIPLPPSLWAHFGPRHAIAESYAVLGVPVPSEPLSLTPAAGLDALLGIIPPLAMLCAMVRLRAYRPQWLAVALIAGTVAGIALGALQVASGNPLASSWYLYADTNWGRAVGFFANADHMASLLALTIPFLAAMVASARGASKQRYWGMIAAAAGLGIVIVAGLTLNGSLAGYGLALPVVAASLLVILPQGSRWRMWTVAAAAALMIGAVTALETTAIGTSKLGQHATSASQSRAELLGTTMHATKDFMPFGSGLGSFRSVYALYENPVRVNDVYAVHAHNDYAEVALELGLAGVILILVFLIWWVVAVWRVWRTAEARPFARAATIASAAVLIHSTVDFPLRTAAIAGCFGVCLGLLADRRAALRWAPDELRPARHVVI